MERRNASSITEADIGKVFLMFEDPSHDNNARSNRMFTVVSVDPVIVRFAQFNNTLSAPEQLYLNMREREIIELQIPLELMHIMRGFTPGGLSFLEQQAALKREEERREEEILQLRQQIAQQRQELRKAREENEENENEENEENKYSKRKRGGRRKKTKKTIKRKGKSKKRN